MKILPLKQCADFRNLASFYVERKLYKIEEKLSKKISLFNVVHYSIKMAE